MTNLYRLCGQTPVPITEIPFNTEKELQNSVERNLKPFMGVSFLASEYSTGSHGGRIDTIGLDDFNAPVIIEYKLDADSSVINQGLFYINWLVNNKPEFQLLVQEKLGYERSRAINWLGVRLICVAKSFTKYDKEAIHQINSNIDLIEYTHYSDSIFGFTTVTQARRPDYRTGPQLPQRQTMLFAHSLLEAELNEKIVFECFCAKLKEISDEIMAYPTGRHFVVSGYDSHIFARLYFNASLRLKLEVFSEPHELNDTFGVRTRKTSNGFEIALKGEKNIGPPIEWIRSMFSKRSFIF